MKKKRKKKPHIWKKYNNCTWNEFNRIKRQCKGRKEKEKKEQNQEKTNSVQRIYKVNLSGGLLAQGGLERGGLGWYEEGWAGTRRARLEQGGLGPGLAGTRGLKGG